MRRFFSRLGPSGRIAAGFALALLGAATWWWLDQQRSQPPAADQARRPDSYFRKLDAVRHNETGQPEVRVEAEYAEHYEDETWIYLHELVARGLETDAPGWEMTAERGRMSEDGSELEAHGNVVMTRQTDGREPLRMETDALWVNTETKLATTDSVVVISQGASRIRGRGMHAALQDDRLQLKQDVEAYYEK